MKRRPAGSRCELLVGGVASLRLEPPLFDRFIYSFLISRDEILLGHSSSVLNLISITYKLKNITESSEHGGIGWRCALTGRVVCSVGLLGERIERHHGQPQLTINRRGRRTGKSRAFRFRIWLTSCPISRADSNINMPTYAEHARLQRYKIQPVSPILSFPRTPMFTSSSPHLLRCAGYSHWCMLCG